MTEAPRIAEPIPAPPSDPGRHGISYMALDFTILKVNPTMERWYPRATPLVGKKCYEAYHGRTTPCDPCFCYQTLTTGEIGHAFVTQKEPSGAVKRWLELFVLPLLDPDTNTLMGVVQYGRDVTEEKKTAEALRASETRYRNLVEQIPAVVYLSDPENFGTALYIAPQVEDFLGFSPLDFQTIPDLWEKLVYPEDRARVMAEVDRCKSTGEPFALDYRMVSKDGQVKWFQDKAWLVSDADGQPLFLQGIFQDISERKILEEDLVREKEKYRVLVDRSPLGKSIIGPDGHYKYLNPTFTDLFGYTLDDLPTGQEWFARAYPEADYRRDVISAWKMYLEESAEGKAQPRTFDVTCKDGSVKTVQFRATPLRGGDQFLLYEDVTEHHRAEKALQQSELKYRSLVEQIPAITYIAGLDYYSETSYVSPQIETILGFSPADFETDPHLWSKQIHPDDRDWVLAELAKSSEMKEPFSAEYRMVAKDGRTIWVRDGANLICDSAGQPMFIQGVMRDITTQKEMEEALKKSKDKYQLLVSQIPALVFRGFEDWSIECFDDKIEELTGYSKEEFNSRRLTWRDLIPVEELPHVKRKFQEALQGDGTYLREHRVRKKDGDYAWVQCRGKIFTNDKGEVEYISGVTFDITSRKRAEMALEESEKRYRLLAEHVSDVIWVVDLDLKFSYVSPSIEHLLGFTPKEIMGKTIGEVLPPASLGTALEIFAEELAIERQGPTDLPRARVFEIEELHKNGFLVWTEVKARFIRDTKNQPIGILGVTRDITKRKQSQQTLARREAILEAVSFAAEKFLHTDSWEDHLGTILEGFGRATETCKAVIFENHEDKDGTLVSSNKRLEWVKPGTKAQMDVPLIENVGWQNGSMTRWRDLMTQGQPVFGNVKNFPAEEQAILIPQGIKSIIAVPIFVEAQWWGFIGFNECLREREWASAEVEALKVAASTLGAAILHTKKEQAIRESEEKLRLLSTQLLETQESERRRLASELHDILGHDLVILKLKLETLENELLSNQVSQKNKIRHITHFLHESLKNLRRLYQDLTPGGLEDLGLRAALKNLLAEFASLKQVTWGVELDNFDNLFDLPTQTVIYRIIQECLTNIGKHANAKNISLWGQKEPTGVSFAIQDDGQGFSYPEVHAKQKTMGLLSMEERVRNLGGSMEIQSEKNKGTRISFTIPLTQGGSL